MPSEDYHKAMRQGLKEVKAAQALGEETGPRTLPDAPEKLAVRRESLGLAAIPVEQIAGTCNHLRGDAFSRGFYPILPADTEFAAKWSALCRIHLEEGIRDPVKVVEYLNHFYVMEGHKRVSEMCIRDSNWVVNHAYNAASYILEHDNSIQDGEAIDGIEDGQLSRQIQWTCRYEDALIQPPRGVLDIHMGKYASGKR